MSGILRALTTAFSWTFPAANSVVTLVLGGLVGWGIRELLSLPGRGARDRKLSDLMKTAARQALEEDWQKRHPGEALTIAVHDQIAASVDTAIFHITGDSAGYQGTVARPIVSVVERGESEKNSGKP